MKRNQQIVLAISIAAVAGLIWFTARKRSTNKNLRRVASEGYETAADVLFPQNVTLGKKLHYGPVLPQA